MPDERQINQKIEELFSENENANKDMEEVLLTERSEMVDLSPEEVAEVKDAVKDMLGKKEAREALKPKPKWTWKFYGFYLFKALIFLAEYAFIALSIYFLLPLAINTVVTLIQAVSITTLLTIYRQWIK